MLISEAQNAVKSLVEKLSKNDRKWNAFVILADLTEEMGEVAEALKIIEGYKKKPAESSRENFSRELADLLYSLLMLASEYQINLEEEFQKVLKSYESRFLK